jgi:hypothetical protein
MAGKPKYPGENKKPREITMTDSGWMGLEEKARSLGLSRSEYIEQIARGVILVVDPGPLPMGKLSPF